MKNKKLSILSTSDQKASFVFQPSTRSIDSKQPSFKELRFEEPKLTGSSTTTNQKSQRKEPPKIVLKKSCLKNRQQTFSYSNFIGNNEYLNGAQQQEQREQRKENLDENKPPLSVNKTQSIYNITFSSAQLQGQSLIDWQNMQQNKPVLQNIPCGYSITKPGTINGEAQETYSTENQLSVQGQKVTEAHDESRTSLDMRLRPKNSALGKFLQPKTQDDDIFDVSNSFIKQDPNENLDTEYANDDEQSHMTLSKRGRYPLLSA
jgi:hypothetical protein